MVNHLWLQTHICCSCTESLTGVATVIKGGWSLVLNRWTTRVCWLDSPERKQWWFTGGPGIWRTCRDARNININYTTSLSVLSINTHLPWRSGLLVWRGNRDCQTLKTVRERFKTMAPWNPLLHGLVSVNSCCSLKVDRRYVTWETFNILCYLLHWHL